jgi:hypothetical protein
MVQSIQPWEAGDGDALTVETLVQQVALVRNAKERVMQKDVHYGVIPGTGTKPTLLKAGAETLLFLFRYRPVINDSDVRVEDHGGGHRTYSVVCRVYNRHGEEVGTGVGVCSTMETRYRFRSENTGQPVPKDYWKTRDSNILGGPQFTARKKAGTWVICEQVEHPNPVDYWNTAEKMAKKRALVDAALTTTAASEHFTQDVEDNPALFGGTTDADAKPAAAPVADPQPRAAEPPVPQAAPTPAAMAPRSDGRAAPAKAAKGAPEQAAAQQMTAGMVEAVKTSTGTSANGKPWTRTGLKVGGAWFNTFSEDFGELAEQAKDSGRPVQVTFTKNEYGNQVVDMALTGGAGPAPEQDGAPEPPPWGNEDVPF